MTTIPWSGRVCLIESDRERRRLREIVTRLRPPELGFIIRTAGEGAREADLEADVRYLASVWEEVQRRRDEVRAPAPLYAEPSLPLRVIRDIAHARTRRIVVDEPAAHEQMAAFLERFVADPKPRLEHYRGSAPIFDHFGIEPQIDANLGKKVWLKSGGYLIVDQSEALTAIDPCGLASTQIDSPGAWWGDELTALARTLRGHFGAGALRVTVHES